MTRADKNAWTDDDIAALVDGTIEDAAEVERLTQVVASDDAAAELAADLRALRELSREAFDAPMREPTPARIEAAIFGEPSKVAVFHGRARDGANRPRPATGFFESPKRLAAAAAVTLAVGVSAGMFWSGDQDGVAALGVAPRDGALHAALETRRSGELAPEGVQPMLSFLDRNGRPCREFEVFGEIVDKIEFGVACREDGGRWRVEMLVAAPITPPGPQGYAPASGPAAAALDSLLDALGAGQPLSPEQEASWIERSWRHVGDPSD